MTDEEIDRLLTLPKTVLNPRARGKIERGARKINYDLSSDAGRFSLYIRQNVRISFNFSCGLLYFGQAGAEKITLARYNGSDHPHANAIEESGRTIHGCHIHKATARYIAAGMKPESYAELTSRYTDLRGAIVALVDDCRITGLPSSLTETDTSHAQAQLELFDDSDN
ncbi:hypothetical protein [Paralcaligenes ureilyticus]|uniref:Uncharacterized protein n=1 Tax=Paralcaligenes ureilyticus TaxID=627131 RepID=A0A4R3MDF7_9BURK|nr:hypothetical protein [Paralcaligenes ureilyticus]TCT10953.1 hypothetical protein EDC26_101175 [Paralcaligenes ureilyticus]